MSDAKLLLLVESRKKSGVVAALLNLILPGAGYLYCGRWLLGPIVFVITLFVAIATFGALLFPIWLILIVDGFLCAGRYNRELIERALATGKV